MNKTKFENEIYELIKLIGECKTTCDYEYAWEGYCLPNIIKSLISKEELERLYIAYKQNIFITRGGIDEAPDDVVAMYNLIKFIKEKIFENKKYIKLISKLLENKGDK